MNCWKAKSLPGDKPISSQAWQACQEGSETRWIDTILSCKTPLASDTRPLLEGDDIVRAIVKAVE